MRRVPNCLALRCRAIPIVYLFIVVLGYGASGIVGLNNNKKPSLHVSSAEAW